MRPVLAWIWLAIVVAAIAWLALVARAGFPIQTDLLALLPREERDPVVQQANEAVSRSIGRRVFPAFGNADRESARASARQAIDIIDKTGLVERATRLAALGAILPGVKHVQPARHWAPGQ